MATTRNYDNSARAAAALATRARIVAVARELLPRMGYRALTIAELARAAEVSPQTVYNTVGGKAEVLKAAYDTTLAGDEGELPMSQRPEFLAMRDTPDAAGHARAYAAWTRAIHERVGPLLATVLAHAGADPALTEFVATIERERRTGNTHFVTALAERHGLPAGSDPEQVVDQVWALTAPDLADRLIRRRGWAAARYEAWLGDHLVLAVTGAGPGDEH